MPILTTRRNNPAGKRYCITCGKSGGVLICDGCQLTFCGRHVVKHRQDLTDQLDDIMHDHDLLRQDIEQSSSEYIHLRKIDKWEQESIKKIQIAAENVRIELRQILDKSKRRLRRISHTIALDLNSSCKADDFLEQDLTRWTKQLKDLHLKIKSSYSLELIEDQRSPIHLLTINNNKLRKNVRNPSHMNPDEHFFKTTNSASIENGGLIAKHNGPDLDCAHIIGKQLYSQGCHTTRFKILKITLPYMLFFGCISSEGIPKSLNYSSPFVVGWFGHNEIYQHGIWNNNLDKYGYDSNEIQTNDILCLTFNCDQKQIELFHERINKTYKLSVNIDKAPFPWQILVVLTHEDDCVKILPKR